jgi:hypothetical protein
MRIRTILLAAILLPGPSVAAASVLPDTTLAVLLHSHALFDTYGSEGPVLLQQAAREAGIGAVVLTEQLITEWTWAPPLLRIFGGAHLRRVSVSSYGVERYFREVAEADRQVPEVTLLAGVEVAPYYRWSGAPWSGSLTMWDWQRNLLVLGLPEPSDYEHLPVVGLRSRLIASLRDLPWLVLVVGIGFAFLVALNRLRVLPTLLTLTLFGLLIWSGPPPPAPYSPYGPDPGVHPWQTLIDSVRARGGLAMWTQVEAVDDSRPLRGWVHIHTDPHPQVLLETRGYQMLGAIYPSTSSAQEPGREWDRALLAYLAGERTEPVWGWGESALHYPSQVTGGTGGKRVDEVLSFVRTPSTSPRDILAALAAGRGWSARSAVSPGRLELDGFAAVRGEDSAGCGEWLEGPGPLRIEAAWRFEGPDPPLVRARLVRDGRVVVEHSGRGAMRLDWAEPAGAAGEQHYFRLEVDSQAYRLLTNPVFIRFGGLR